MEMNMDNVMETLGTFKGYIGIYRDITPMMENHIWKMKWKLLLKGAYRVYSIG